MTQTTTETNEQKQVLEMLADGKIGVEDAHKLLDKLRSGAQNRPAAGGDPPRKSAPKYLRIVATEGDDEEAINLRIPLSLVRAGLTINSFLPSWMRKAVIVNAGGGGGQSRRGSRPRRNRRQLGGARPQFRFRRRRQRPHLLRVAISERILSVEAMTKAYSEVSDEANLPGGGFREVRTVQVCRKRDLGKFG